MAETNADILMKFVDDTGPVQGESVLQKAKGDGFMTDFNPASGYTDYADFFEVDNFNFSIQVDPNSSDVGALSNRGSTVSKAPVGGGIGGQMGAAALAALMGTDKKQVNDPYDRWRTLTRNQAMITPYPVKFDTFSFERVIDSASPIFFQKCANQKSFPSAVLVKRVSTGNATSGSTPMNLVAAALGGGSDATVGRGFLRIDFEDVLLTSVSWNDGDMVTESCSFTCARMLVQYQQQQASGGLVGVVSSAKWDRLINGQPNSKKPGAV